MYRRYIIPCLLAALCAGCASTPLGSAWPKPRPLGCEISTYRPPQKPETDISGTVSLPEARKELRLRDALALALRRSPDLAGVALSVREAEAEALQAGLLPNPEVGAEFEDFAGTGDLAGTKSAETTITVGQLIELGGKRAKRIRQARLEAELAGWDYEAKRIGLITDVAQRFAAVLARQRKAALADTSLKLAKATRDAVNKRLKAGKITPVELAKAEVEVSTARISVRRAGRELLASKHRLAAAWGATSPHFEVVAGDLNHIGQLPKLDQVIPLLAQNPDIARWKTELAQRQAVLSSEKARAISDVTLSAGYRYSNESKDTAALVGISIPLPLFDRNQGGVRKARYGLLRARSEEEATWARLRYELLEAYQELASAHEEAATLRTQVLPAAEQAFKATRTSFDRGKTDYLDVLDAQRTLTDTRRQYVDALASYHRALPAVEGLIAQPLTSASTIKVKEGE